MNLKYQFYKGYYDGFDPCWFEDKKRQEEVDDQNKERFERANKKLFAYKPAQDLGKWLYNTDHFGDHLCQFSLETTYSGLVSGTGYTHETGNVGEFKIGFHFDHTSGLPMLPGHSVKGALRASFPRAKMEQKSTEDKGIKRAKAAYIIHLLNLEGKVTEADQLEWVSQLEMQIFAGKTPQKKDEKPENVQATLKDVFLDAVIYKANKKGQILGSDSITPHGSKVWKNPIPLLFMKVLPEVQWQFSFLLHDTEVAGIPVTAKMKRELFKAILLDQGVGAKSNVGYGHFIDPENRPNSKSGSKSDLATNAQKKYLLVDRPEHQGTQKSQEEKEVKATFFRGTLNHKKQLLMDSVVVESGTPNKVEVYLKEGNKQIIDLGGYRAPLEIGQLIQVIVQLKRDKTINAVNYKSKK